MNNSSRREVYINGKRARNDLLIEIVSKDRDLLSRLGYFLEPRYSLLKLPENAYILYGAPAENFSKKEIDNFLIPFGYKLINAPATGLAEVAFKLVEVDNGRE